MPYGPAHSSVSKWVFFDRWSPLADVVVFDRRLLALGRGGGGGATKYFSIAAFGARGKEATLCNVPDADCTRESIEVCVVLACTEFNFEVPRDPFFFLYYRPVNELENVDGSDDSRFRALEGLSSSRSLRKSVQLHVQ